MLGSLPHTHYQKRRRILQKMHGRCWIQPFRSILCLVSVWWCFASPCPAQGTITTIAGNGLVYSMVNLGLGTEYPFGQIPGVATDRQGNVYGVDQTNRLVFRVNIDQTISFILGNWSGPTGIAVDSAGNTYVLDGGPFSDGGCIIYRVGVDRAVLPFVGASGACGYNGDGMPASQAAINRAHGIAVGPGDNLYIADSANNRIRMVNRQGIISTVAGNGYCCYTGDRVPATSATLNSPLGVAATPGGLYIADTFNDRVRFVDDSGIISTIAGGAGRGYSGDGGPATSAMLNWPASVAVDVAGNLFIADRFNHRVRKVALDGSIQTVVGTGTANFTGDLGSGSAATVNTPSGLAVDGSGNLYIADTLNFRIRRLDSSGVIRTIAGNGNYAFAGDGGQAYAAVLNHPLRAVLDTAGNILVVDSDNNRVRRITRDAIITTVAGSNAPGFAGDGGPATQALLSAPSGVAVDSAGNLFIADSGNARVRKVDSNGIITTFASGPFRAVGDIAIDSRNNLYITDPNSIGPVFQISPSGFVSPLPSGFRFPSAVATDASDNVYVSQPALQPSSRAGAVIQITPSGSSAFRATGFINPQHVAFDSNGNMYVPDPDENRVVRVAADKTQTVIAGVGPAGFSGDGGPSTSAQLNRPTSVAIDALGNVLIADSANNRIRKILLNPGSGLPAPATTVSLPAGFYIATVQLGQGEHQGYWGLGVSTQGVLSGGFNCGGAIQAANLPPGFCFVSLHSTQEVHVHIDAEPAGAGTDPGLGLSVRLLDGRLNPIGPGWTGTSSVDFTVTLTPGPTILEVRGGNQSRTENFQASLSAPAFSGVAYTGGFVEAGTVGFGAFYLPEAQQVSLKVFGQAQYGGDGAGALRLTLRDASQNVLLTVP
jgi:trimeric autotransporter adhesin